MPCDENTGVGTSKANEVKAALARAGTYGDGDGLFLKASKAEAQSGFCTFNMKASAGI